MRGLRRLKPKLPERTTIYTMYMSQAKQAIWPRSGQAGPPLLDPDGTLPSQPKPHPSGRTG